MTSPDTGLFVDRATFMSRWGYQSGEHVTILAPTNWGKTHLMHQLISQALTTDRSLTAISLVMKGRDRTVERFNRELGFKRVYDWPPRVSRMSRWIGTPEPRGYSLWPKPGTGDLLDEREEENMARVFLRAMSDAYRSKRRYALLADETAGMATELTIDGKLVMKPALKKLWRRGRTMDCGLWAVSQRPVDMPLEAYSMPEHLFIGYDPDVRARKRYDEIGGIDRGVVDRATQALNRYEWFYIRRSAGRRGLGYVTIGA